MSGSERGWWPVLYVQVKKAARIETQRTRPSVALARLRIWPQAGQGHSEQHVGSWGMCMPGKANLVQRGTSHVCNGVSVAVGPAFNVTH